METTTQQILNDIYCTGKAKGGKIRRHTIHVTGNIGAGKTTLFTALASCITNRKADDTAMDPLIGTCPICNNCVSDFGYSCPLSLTSIDSPDSRFCFVSVPEQVGQIFSLGRYYDQVAKRLKGDPLLSFTSLQTQLYFLLSYINRLCEVIEQIENEVEIEGYTGTTHIIILFDRGPLDTLHVFSQVMKEQGVLLNEDFDSFSSLYAHLVNRVRTLFGIDLDNPSLLIYLKATDKTLMKRILKRNRDVETQIEEKYISTLNVKYDSVCTSESMKSMKTLKTGKTGEPKVMVIDTENKTPQEVQCAVMDVIHRWVGELTE